MIHRATRRERLKSDTLGQDVGSFGSNDEHTIRRTSLNMQRSLTLLSLIALPLALCAQNIHRSGRVAERMEELRATGATFRTIPLFTTLPRSAASDQRWQGALRAGTLMRLDRGAVATLLNAREERVTLQLAETAETITVDLERVDITAEDFEVTLASTGGAAAVGEGLHYRGWIRGVPGSLAAISVFDGEVMGLLSDVNGERVLGRLADDTEGDHIFYREQDLRGTSGRVCHTPEDDMGEAPTHGSATSVDRTAKCVRFYWEVNYDIVQGKGSVANAFNYVTGLFNQSAILYANDGISVTLSQVYAWDVPSPYTSSSTSTQLSTFGTTRTSFNGDLAHLLGYTGGGGVAWVNTICSGQTRYRMAYSDINSTYQNVPVFSWSVEVVTHEQGHNMGSPHTHACSWNGNNTAIDGCGPAAGYAEGSCAQGPVPSSSVGGTIMSYCHLTNSGINFSNGFGPQPAALIIGRINNASCLVNCGTVTCSTPSALAATSITSTSATLSWTAGSGVTVHTVQWKASAASGWNTVGAVQGATYVLAGLSAGTSYQFQVRSDCAASSSAYAAPASFTTAAAGCAPPATLQSTAITSTSATLTWAATSGATSYSVQWKNASANTWTTVNGIVATSHGLTGLAPSTAYQFQVRAVCASGTSGYGTPQNFSTVGTCADPHEPNNSLNNGRVLAPSTTTMGLVASRYDQDWFRFANTSAARNIRVRLTGLPANYSLTLYRGTTVVGTSNVTGTGDEQIILNAATIASNYAIRVAGVSGAYSATQCYTLSVETAGTAFSPEAMMESAEPPSAALQGLIVGVHPNPAHEMVTIEWAATDEATRVELIDGVGRTVQVIDHPTGSSGVGVLISVADRTPGLYFVRVTRGAESEVRRLVVER